MMNRVAACLAGAVLGLTLGVTPAAAAPAVADFSVSPATPTVGGQMTLDARNLADPDGTAYTYDWNVDGTDYTGAVVNVLAVADPPDHHTSNIVLTVTDPATPDDPATVTKNVTVHHKPVAKIGSPSRSLNANDQGTFTDESSDLDNDIKDWSWTVNGTDEGAGDPSTHELKYKFPSPGTYRVALTVKDADGNSASAEQTVDIAARAPVASFTYSPSDPVAGQPVQLDASDSSDPDGSTLSYAWETNGDDQFDEGTDPTSPVQTVTFPQAGDYTVKLRVTDASGEHSEATQTISVQAKPDAAPTAAFTYAPANPVVGQAVTFTSTSTDSDGTIVKYLWDVNNDGRFVEGGPTLTTTFSRAAAQTVTLKVVDDGGASATTFKTVTVSAPPVTPPPQDKAKTSSTPLPIALNPFPIVRMRGLILRRGVAVQILSIRAPEGAVVSVRCKGHGCPVKRVRVKLQGNQHGVRIHKLERRLRVGTVIEIRITKKNSIGKYTRFVIRRNAAPSRRDLCVGPASKRPVRCSA
jgi:PKD repeat protein